MKYIHDRIKSGVRFMRFIVQNFCLMFYINYIQRKKRYEKGKVTIITATYNRLDKLKEAIDSVMNQTYSNWQQIVVSDGHDNKVNELIKEINNPKIFYCNTFELHTVGNYQKNYALRFATGEFVLHLDDDNLIYQDCLSTMTSGFENKEIGYVVCPIKYGNTFKKPKEGFKYREIDTLNFMVRRKLLEKVGGWDVHGSSDYLLIDKIRKIYRGKYLNQIIGHHR